MCVADRDTVADVVRHLVDLEVTCAELSKDGPAGDGDVHVGTMHRFKGPEYQRLAVVGVRDGVVPRTAVSDRFRADDPARYRREERKARSLLFVAATRARDTLRISWHDRPSPYLPIQSNER